MTHPDCLLRKQQSPFIIHGMGRPKSDVPKTTVSMRIPDSTLSRIDEWASGHSLSRSEALRRVMQAGYTTLKVG